RWGVDRGSSGPHLHPVDAADRAYADGAGTLAYQRAATELVAAAVQEEPYGGATRHAAPARQVGLAPGRRVPARCAAVPDAGADRYRHLAHEGRAALSGLGAGGSAGGLSPAAAGVGAADPALPGADQHSAAVRVAVLLGLGGFLDGADGLLPAAKGA